MKRLLSLATLFPNAHQPRFGTFVARSLEALAARGDWQVTVINPIGLPVYPGRSRTRRKQLLGSARENGLEVHRVGFPIIPALSGPFNSELIARAVGKTARELHAGAPFDLIDAQFFFPDGPAAETLSHLLGGLPFAIKARGADISYWGRRRHALRQMREAGWNAALLLAVSEALKADMIDIGLPANRIAVHYTGLDRDLFNPLDRFECRTRLAEHFGFALPAGAPLLATVGALIPRKGQEFVLDALARIPHAHLLLAGKGPDEAKLRAQAARLGIAERVHFLGSLDHTLLPVLLSACDALVSPSASEGLANAWVEALACGCPLVITDAGGARELLTSAAAGRIVPRDEAAIAEAVQDLLADPPSREAVAATAERFDWRSHAAALDALYSDVIAA